jgi:hypothetical protein
MRCPACREFPWGYGEFSLMINIFVCFPHPISGRVSRESGRGAYKDDGSDRCDWQPGHPSADSGSLLLLQGAILGNYLGEDDMAVWVKRTWSACRTTTGAHRQVITLLAGIGPHPRR